MVDLDSCFPYKEYRKYQREVLFDAFEAFDDNDVVVVNAPVGFGKSGVNLALCRAMGSAFYTTPLKSQQDQLAREFGDSVVVLKGRDNYNCLIEEEKTKSQAKCMIATYRCLMKDSCPYTKAMKKARTSRVSCMNTALMMQMPSRAFDKRELLVVDEGHGLGEWGVMFAQVSLGVDVVGDIPNLDNFDQWIEWITEKVDEVSSRMVEIEGLVDPMDDDSDLITRDMVLLYKKLQRAIFKMELLVDDYLTHDEEWTVDVSRRSVVFRPLTSGRFLDKLLWRWSGKILISSGTIINESVFKRETGLDKKNCEFISVPSTFPVENRLVYRVESVGVVNHKNKVEKMSRIVGMIKKIMVAHNGLNGVVHCHSYENALALNDGLRGSLDNWVKHKINGLISEYVKNYDYDSFDKNVDGVWLQNRDNRDESLKRWIDDSEPSLFLSVNFTEGIDLKDDLCRYAVLMKVPFMDLSDKRVEARIAKGDRNWYESKAIESIVQSWGRGVRSEDDYCDFYILDGSFWRLWKNNLELFPKDFNECVRYCRW